MAVKAGTAYVDIEGDFGALNKQVSSHFTKLTKDADKTGKKIGTTLGAGLAAGVGAVLAGKATRAVFDWGKDIVGIASDVNESLSKNQVLFGKYAGGIEDFSDRSANAFGISKKAALEYTGVFGNLFKAFGFTSKKSARMSVDLVKTAADMASFNNASIADTLDAIKSGLVGETEPLRKYGVTINDNALKSEALSSGLVKAHVDQVKMRASTLALDIAQQNLGKAVKEHGANSTEAKKAQLALEYAQQRVTKTAGGQTIVLTASQKALAARNLIIKQSAAAHGDFAKTSDELANSQKRLGARWEDMKGTLGASLLPAVKSVAGSLLDLADDVQPKVERAVKEMTKIFGDKDLDIGEKLKKSFEVAKRSFGPVADNIVQGLKGAHLDEKLGDVVAWAAPKVAAAFKAMAPVVVKAFLDGFLAAPSWAKLVASGWLLNKMGGANALQSVGSNAGGQMATGVATGFRAKAGMLMRTAGKNVLAAAVIAGVTEGIAVSRADLGLGQKIDTWVNSMTLGMAGVNWTDKFAKVQQMIDQGLEPPKLDPGLWNVNPFKDLTPVDWEHYINHQGFNEEQKKVLLDLKAVHDGAIAVATDLAQHDIVLDVKVLNSKEAIAAAQGVGDAIDKMENGSSTSVQSLRTNVRFNMRAIKKSLGEDSAAGKEAVSANFSAAIENIKTSMTLGTISVKEGTALIQEYMTRSLMNFGFSHEQALNIARDPTRRTSATGGPEEGTRGPGKQRGGWINMGAASGDSVHAMLERDEYVLNRKAVKKVGKAALDRLNFGLAPRFQKGGSVTGDTDFLPALMNALRALSASVGRGIFVQSGRRTVAEQLAQGPSTPGHPVAGPNGPHVRGVAADITPVGGGTGYSVFGSAAGKFGLGFTVMPQEPWHIQLLDAAKAAGAQAITAVAQTVAGVKVGGPDSALKSIAQNAIDATQGAAQGVVNQVFASLAPAGGEAGPTAGTATGSGADLMKAISSQRGWNFADWWAIDAKETGHGANLSNPTSTARLRGQFLDMNWGKYGPGSDPRQNPSMSQQIQSMALYIAERYGNPTKALAWHNAHNWYQSGGVVGKLMGMVTGGAALAAKVKNPLVGGSAHSKTHKPKNHLSAAMIKALGQAGATQLQTAMDTLKGEADKYADWADRASNLVDTSALQQALNAEMTKRGGRQGMTDAQLLALFPAGQQDAFIDTWLRGNASFNGGIESDWLTSELNQLLAWRNALIDNPPVFQGLIATAMEAYKKLKAEIKRIQDDIKLLEKRRDAAIKKEEDQHQALVDAKSELAKEQGKKKPDRARVKRLGEHVDKYRAGEAAAHAERASYNAQLSQLRGNQRTTEAAAVAIGGDDGKGGRIGDLNEAITTMSSSLIDVHGLGSTMQRFVSPSQFQLGALGGTILGVQNSILGLTRNPARASADEAATEPPGPTEGETRTKEILAELLREANLRTAVSEAQFDVFRNLPFGGSFKEGGMVPGPYGAPRMIMAHGGEVVIPNDASNMPNVSVHFASGMEWLQRFVSVQVDNQTRQQSRRSERQLPGQPGVLR